MIIQSELTVPVHLLEVRYTGWPTKCHTIDCRHNTFLLLKKHLTSGTEFILIGQKIVPNEEHVQCDNHFASQPLANDPLHSSQFSTQVFRKRAAQLHYVGPELRYIFWPHLEHFLFQEEYP